MAAVATAEFLKQLSDIYPSGEASTPEAILEQPWFLSAAVAFSASNQGTAVPALFKYVLAQLEQAQSGVAPEQKLAQKLALANKFREALLQSTLLVGIPRITESLLALHSAVPEELHAKDITRDRTKSIADYENAGEQMFKVIYGDTADNMHKLLFGAYPDFGWFVVTAAYGITGASKVLTRVQTSATIISALIPTDAARQLQWHMGNARKAGASVEQVKAIREIAIKISEKANITWKDGIPDVSA
ncbi:hypothetical protein WOLCODRAFT_15966 [Wolfiporia cocos MD-104 SS10]|uniref:Carboxymuconolactone decarboxylase-like domain-containing protein n=1 Tax=Wolfiporia cocos (strain MD-104) TaxID=742152 RepID=A0A2H3JIM4_WOLCO|nr:hypothetical protein WOLCODRAFT_15966 [Wolfiporia cocos MD-104 SS10]